MKKIAFTVLLLTMALGLCACTEVTSDRTMNTNPDAAMQPEAPVATMQNAPEAQEELKALLGAIRQEYQPGTAGCSLTAVRLAGRLLDWNATCQPDVETIGTAARAYRATLKYADVPELMGQVADIYTTAMSLFGDAAKDALEAAGYAPQRFPWDEDAAQRMFAALAAGLGIELPLHG